MSLIIVRKPSLYIPLSRTLHYLSHSQDDCPLGCNLQAHMRQKWTTLQLANVNGWPQKHICVVLYCEHQLQENQGQNKTIPSHFNLCTLTLTAKAL